MWGYRNSGRGWAVIATMFGIVHGSYLATPEFQWSIPLVSTVTSSLFEKGNSIVSFGSDRLAITSSNGTLYLMSTNNVVVSSNTVASSSSDAAKSFNPSLVNGLDTIQCNGGIIAALASSSTDIVMYAITDTDSQGTIPPTSRILAVDAETAKLVWNTTIDGTIAGTPVLSENGFLYVVHNAESTSAESNAMSRSGVVSIFQVDVFAGTSLRPKLITKLPNESTGLPFGPAAVATKDGNDILFFAENLGDFGETFTESLFVIAQTGDDFAFALASRAISSTSTPPTLRDNGAGQLEVFLGQPESTLLAWIDDNAAQLLTGLENSSSSPSYRTPSWRFSVAPNSDSETGAYSY